MRANYLLADVLSYRRMVRDEEPCSKVVFVPKDSRGPRTICCEPLEIQYIQQGIARRLVSHIELRSTAKGQVNFTDQTINQRLALLSSKNQQWATIDLKDASDLVSIELVKCLVPPEIWRVLDACRSTHARLPSGRKIKLEKFAPMGSALCFPIESLVFYSICVAALVLNRVPLQMALRSVYVYGDDIIVPTEHVQVVIDSLTLVGLAVNLDKSCYRSYFRESCGCDAWLGHDVTPQRIKKVPARRPCDGNALAAWAAYAGQFWDIQMYETGEYCRELISNVIGFIPVTDREEKYLSIVSPKRVSTLEEYGNLRWNAELQLFQARMLCVTNRKRKTRMDSWERLLNNLLVASIELDPSEVVERESTLTRYRWVNIYVNPSVKTDL